MKWALRAIALLILVGVVAGAVFYRDPLGVVEQQTRWRLWRAGVSSRYVEADEYKLHYFEAGPRGGVPLVLVHGLGARGEDWSAMIPALAGRGFHVYAPDLLGYGRSPKPEDVDYSIGLQAKTVESFMRAVGVPRADVGGWSMGGWVAMKLTIDHPEMVDRLVIYDSAGVYFPATFNADLFVPSDVSGVRRLMKVLSPRPAAMPEFAARDAVRKLQENGWVIRRSMDSMVTGRDLLDFQLYKITQPMLIVWGAEDELIPLAVGESIHDKVPQSVLEVVPGCGHLAPLECSQAVVESTANFLRAEPPMAGGKKILKAGL